METQIFQTNPRLRGLLLILIFTFAASGITLVVLAQIQSYHREQIYLATESALPKHAAALKKFLKPEFGISFAYPGKLTLSEKPGQIVLSHQTPYKNSGDCDMKGGSEVFDYLTDFRVSFEMFSGTVKQAVLKNSPYMPVENYSGDTLKISPGFIDPYQIGNLSGFAILEGAEGCGRVIYYFPVESKRVLMVDRANIQALSPVTAKELRDDVLAVPGVITPEENEKIFGQILESFRILPPQDVGRGGGDVDISTWKTYRNEKYGYEFEYPSDYIVNADDQNKVYNFTSADLKINYHIAINTYSREENVCSDVALREKYLINLENCKMTKSDLTNLLSKNRIEKIKNFTWVPSHDLVRYDVVAENVLYSFGQEPDNIGDNYDNFFRIIESFKFFK